MTVFLCLLLMLSGAAMLTPQIPENPFESPPENFRDFAVEFELLGWGVRVLEARDGVLWASRIESESPWMVWVRETRTGDLLFSLDHGESWTLKHSFSQPVRAIYISDAGYLFVTTSNDRWSDQSNGRLYRSANGGESFYHVLDIQSGVAMRWNIASHNEMVFVSEYGIKFGNNNARRIYRSLDYGKTWNVVFEPIPMPNYHHHRIVITDEGIIYQSVGDGHNSQIMQSLDNGTTWQTRVDGISPTSALVFDDSILWGMNGGPWYGVARYDRATGEITEALRLPYPFHSSCYDMLYVNGVVYALFLKYGSANHPAGIFYSQNRGETWYLLGYIVTNNPSFGIGFYNITTDGLFAYVNIETPVYFNGARHSFTGTMRFELLETSTDVLTPVFLQ